jgi:hypothetical protein
VPMTEADTVKPDVSSTTVTTKPATPASPPVRQYSSSRRVRRVSGALKTMPAARRSSDSIELLSSAGGLSSRVAAGQRPGADGERDHRVQAQHTEPYAR